MKFERKLQIKIAFGYVVMLAIGISMAFILVHERKRMKNIETETTNIRNVRKSIGIVHRFITELAISGETIIGWKTLIINTIIPCDNKQTVYCKL